MKKITFLFFTLCLLAFISCKKDKVETTPVDSPIVVDSNRKNLNISLLLDLSDRISPQKYPNPAMEFYQRDAAYITSVANSFLSHVRSKKVIKLNDQMQLFFNPEPSNPEINKLSTELKTMFNKNTEKKQIDEVKTVYETHPLKIYESAIKDGKYIGSDTWSFFKDNVRSYCMKDTHRNILVILTDGYMFYENGNRREGNQTNYLSPEFIRSAQLTDGSWQSKMNSGKFSFIPATENLENLEVLVLGINANPGNPYEKDVIKAYWSKWLSDMGVKKHTILDADLPSNLDSVIRDFILAKK